MNLDDLPKIPEMFEQAFGEKFGIPIWRAVFAIVVAAIVVGALAGILRFGKAVSTMIWPAPNPLAIAQNRPLPLRPNGRSPQIERATGLNPTACPPGTAICAAGKAGIWTNVRPYGYERGIGSTESGSKWINPTPTRGRSTSQNSLTVTHPVGSIIAPSGGENSITNNFGPPHNPNGLYQSGSQIATIQNPIINETEGFVNFMIAGFTAYPDLNRPIEFRNLTLQCDSSLPKPDPTVITADPHESVLGLQCKIVGSK